MYRYVWKEVDNTMPTNLRWKCNTLLNSSASDFLLKDDITSLKWSRVTREVSTF